MNAVLQTWRMCDSLVVNPMVRNFEIMFDKFSVGKVCFKIGLKTTVICKQKKGTLLEFGRMIVCPRVQHANPWSQVVCHCWIINATSCMDQNR